MKKQHQTIIMLDEAWELNAVYLVEYSSSIVTSIQPAILYVGALAKGLPANPSWLQSFAAFSHNCDVSEVAYLKIIKKLASEADLLTPDRGKTIVNVTHEKEN